MSQQSEDQSPGQGADPSATDRINAAFELLRAAFDDAKFDSITLSKAEVMQQVVATQQVLNTAWALQSARLAQAGAIEDTFIPDARDPRGFREPQIRHAIGSFHAEFIGAELAPMLGWTTGQANDRVHEATDVITRTPRLFNRVGSGEIDPAKLTAIHRALGRVSGVTDDGLPATRDLAARVEAALLGDTKESATLEQGNTELLARSSAPQIGRRTQRILKSIDPVAAERAAGKRRRDRVAVFAHPDDEPGLSHLHAILPSEVAAKVMAAIDKHARDLHADTTTGKTLAECRADALADLVLGNAKVTAKLVVQVPVQRTDCPAAVGGHRAAAFHPTTGDGQFARSGSCWPTAFAHPITGLTAFAGGRCAAGASRSSGATAVKSQDTIDREFNELLKRMHPPGPDDWADWDLEDDDPPPADPPLPDEERPPKPSAQREQSRSANAFLGDAAVPGIGVIPAAVIEAMSRSFGVTMTRALVDADTGVTLETCETQYRPSARLQHFIETRDVHCRFPGCTRPARWCDIDHLISWPEGPTAAYNLHSLCRHHHRTKQAHGWSVTMTPDGVCTWTSPTGHSYVTTPGE